MLYYCNSGGFYATWQMRGAAAACHSGGDRPRGIGRPQGRAGCAM